MSIFIPTFQAGAAARKAEPYLQAIPNLGATLWWRTDRNTTLVDTNAVSQITDMIAGANGLSGTDGRHPKLIGNQIGGYSAMVFDGVDDNMVFTAISGSGLLASAFTLVLVMQVNAVPSESVYVLSNFGGVGVGTLLQLRADGKIRFLHGTGYVETEMSIGAPSVVLVSYKSGFIRGRYNSVDMLSLTNNRAAASDGNSGGQALVMGAISNVTPTAAAAFSLTDFMFFPRDIITHGPTLRQIEGYAAVRYGAALSTY